MQANKLTESLSVAGQIAPDDVAAIAAAGFKTIINNRPDGEKPGQPASDAVRAAAEAAGLAYHINPLVPGGLTPAIVAEQGRLLREAEGPVLAHCASGNRSTILWALCNPDGLDADERIRRAAEVGYDIAGLRPNL